MLVVDDALEAPGKKHVKKPKIEKEGVEYAAFAIDSQKPISKANGPTQAVCRNTRSGTYKDVETLNLPKQALIVLSMFQRQFPTRIVS